jgi:O-antigen/teichoic acid export membrane protein
MRALNALRFVAGFGTARALLFLAPIVLANLLPLDHYGALELAQSYAAIGALLLGCGLPGTVPLIRLRDEIEGRWDTLLLLMALLAGGCLLIALGTAIGLGSFYSVTVLVPLAIGVLMLQGLWATSLKSDGRSTTAVFVEAGFWAVAVIGAALWAFTGGYLSEATISATLLVYGVGLLIVTLHQFAHTRMGPIAVQDLRRNIALGLPLMLTSVLTVIISSSGRLVLGQTSGVEAVGLYAVLYRSTTLPLVGHQILIIGFFRQIFSWPDDMLRKRASVIVLGVSGMVVLFWLLEPYLGWLLGNRFAETFIIYRTEGLILLVQTILWSAIALNDLINSRLQIAGRVTRITAPVLVVGLGALAAVTWAQDASLGEMLRGFIVGHFALMVGFYAAQCWATWRLGHSFFRLWLTVFACASGTGLLIFLGDYFK